MISMEDYDEQLAKAKAFHGEICGGIAIGTKLAMYGMELMGMELNILGNRQMHVRCCAGCNRMHYGKKISQADVLWKIRCHFL